VILLWMLLCIFSVLSLRASDCRHIGRFCQLIWCLSRPSSYGGLGGRWEWSRVKCRLVLDFSRSVLSSCIRLPCQLSWLLVLTGACKSCIITWLCILLCNQEFNNWTTKHLYCWLGGWQKFAIWTKSKVHCVPKKTTLMLHTIDSTHINRCQ